VATKRTTGKALRSAEHSVLLVSLTIGLVSFAHAHAALVKAEPAQRVSLSKAPSHVRLWFSERLEPAYSAITIEKMGASGPVATGKAVVDPNDMKLLMLELPLLEPGQYTVRYRVLSVDGHTVDYGYTFTVIDGAGKP
jgi:methionine-rich copper-binding protein CopC